jgi:hypothetical protein
MKPSGIQESVPLSHKTKKKGTILSSFENMKILVLVDGSEHAEKAFNRGLSYSTLCDLKKNIRTKIFWWNMKNKALA